MRRTHIGSAVDCGGRKCSYSSAHSPALSTCGPRHQYTCSHARLTLRYMGEAQSIYEVLYSERGKVNGVEMYSQISESCAGYTGGEEMGSVLI